MFSRSPLDLIIILLAFFCLLVQNNIAFSPTVRIWRGRGRTETTTLDMGKGLNKARNKQAALRKKLEEAKRQNSPTTEDEVQRDEKKRLLSEEEIKERNDRLRFEQLLKSKASIVLNDYSSEGYLNRQQEEEEIDAALAGVDRLFEGDPAPTECFQELVAMKSGNAIGQTGAQRLVPWLHKNPARHQDYLVIVSDPRQKSPVLHETVKSLLTELPSDIRTRLIIVNADSPAENRRWLKKSGIPEDKVDVFSDEKMEWMRSYTALGEKRWSMTMFVVSEERVQKLARDIDQYGAARTIRNAVKALNEETRI